MSISRCNGGREARLRPLRLALMAAGSSADAPLRRDWLGHGCPYGISAIAQREQGRVALGNANKSTE